MSTKIPSSVTSEVNSPSPLSVVRVAPIAKNAFPQVLCLPLLQTPTSAKSFPCHSYENTRGGVSILLAFGGRSFSSDIQLAGAGEYLCSPQLRFSHPGRHLGELRRLQLECGDAFSDPQNTDHGPRSCPANCAQTRHFCHRHFACNPFSINRLRTLSITNRGGGGYILPDKSFSATCSLPRSSSFDLQLSTFNLFPSFSAPLRYPSPIRSVRPTPRALAFTIHFADAIRATSPCSLRPFDATLTKILGGLLAAS